MKKKEQRTRQGIDYDDQGIMQVSQLISDSYNSGTVGEEPNPAGAHTNEDIR